MTRAEFATNLRVATWSTFRLTNQLCTNLLSDKFDYLIQPDNLNEHSPHLNELEMHRFLARKAEIGRRFSAEEVVERLWVDGQVPAWINMTVYKAGWRTTTIELLFDRLLWPEAPIVESRGKGYYHVREGYPPFHALVATPPYVLLFPLRSELTSKFNVNWQHWPWRLELLAWQKGYRLRSSFAHWRK